LILSKIVKIVAIRCLILRLKCTKFDFSSAGALPQTPRWGSSQRSPDPLAGLKGPASKGRKVREDRCQEEREGFFLYI